MLAALVVNVAILLCVLKYKGSTNNEIAVYTIMNENLGIDNKLYVVCELEVEPVLLDKQIGKTQDNKQIYSIKGIDSEDFICMRSEGQEIIYRNSKFMPMTDIKRMDFYKMVVRSDGSVEDAFVIDDKSIIQEMLSMLEDENIVQGEVVGEVFEDIVLYSEKYKGLCYKYSYAIDEYGDEYLYDNQQMIAWKFTKHMFDVEVSD